MQLMMSHRGKYPDHLRHVQQLPNNNNATEDESSGKYPDHLRHVCFLQTYPSKSRPTKFGRFHSIVGHGYFSLLFQVIYFLFKSIFLSKFMLNYANNDQNQLF